MINRKFTLSALSFFAIFVSITFVNLTAADTTVKDYPSSKVDNETTEILSPTTDYYTTIANFDFNSSTPACNSAFSTSTGTCTTHAGTSTSATAFTQNTTAGSAVGITGFATGASQYFQFRVGSSLPPNSTIRDFKVYFQAQRSETGPMSVTLQYSIDGTTFTDFQTVSVPTNTTNTFAAYNFDLSSIIALYNKTNFYLRIIGSGGSDNSGTFIIDNFQVFATINTQPLSPTPTVTPSPYRSLDYDGDSRSDYAVFRPGNNTWYVRRSTNGSFFAVQFGLSDDVKTPGDYDGDRRGDIAVWRPSNGTFYVLRSLDNTVQFVQFGQSGDEPVARDYNADRRTDFAVVRRTGGLMIWYILTSNNATFSATQFGLDTDRVAPGNYDDDRASDLAVYRGQGSQLGTFYVQRSYRGFLAFQFGLGSDLIVPGDYDGDGQTDFAVVRRDPGFTWYIQTNSTIDPMFRAVQFGTIPYLPTPADYDGDNKVDISVWNPQNGTFYTIQSSNDAVTTVQFGQNLDFPIANYDTHPN